MKRCRCAQKGGKKAETFISKALAGAGEAPVSMRPYLAESRLLDRADNSCQRLDESACLQKNEGHGAAGVTSGLARQLPSNQLKYEVKPAFFENANFSIRLFLGVYFLLLSTLDLTKVTALVCDHKADMYCLYIDFLHNIDVLKHSQYFCASYIHQPSLVIYDSKLNMSEFRRIGGQKPLEITMDIFFHCFSRE